VKHFEDPFIKILPKLDVHGETSDTVWLVVSNFIRDSIKLNKFKIYVIHGRHSNILKNVIHQKLSKDKRVDKYYTYMWNSGITIIELKK
jgi:DNA-nicking Smr family endonuclease